MGFARTPNFEFAGEYPNPTEIRKGMEYIGREEGGMDNG